MQCHQVLPKSRRCLAKTKAMNTDILFYLMIGVGLLSIVASITNWEWFFKQRRAQMMVRLMGRNGARIFYALLGTFFAVVGWLVLSGQIALGSLF